MCVCVCMYVCMYICMYIILKTEFHKVKGGRNDKLIRRENVAVLKVLIAHTTSLFA